MESLSSEDQFVQVDERLDRIMSIDLGGRGVEGLYRAARELQKGPLCGAAANRLAALPPRATVLLTTGSVSRAWISASVGENDGPAGIASIARALVLGRNAICVLVAEEALLPSIRSILVAAGLTPLSFDEARLAAVDGSLGAVCLLPFPLTDKEAAGAAPDLLDQLKPDLMFSAERVGRNAEGVYCSMRGIDYGMGRARVDFIFDEARRRQIPVLAVGDGGNEIGMGAIPAAVRQHVKFGDKRPNGSAGIGALSSADVLVPAGCSNWGCYAIVAALAARLKDRRLIHTPEMEQRLLERGVEVGLINTVDGVVDPNVDGISMQTHLAVTELLTAVIRPVISSK